MEAAVRRLLGKKETAERVGVHPEHLMRMARQGRFPRPIKLSDEPGSLAKFVEDEVNGWIEERMAARVATAAS